MERSETCGKSRAGATDVRVTAAHLLHHTQCFQYSLCAKAGCSFQVAAVRHRTSCSHGAASWQGLKMYREDQSIYTKSTAFKPLRGEETCLPSKNEGNLTAQSRKQQEASAGSCALLQEGWLWGCLHTRLLTANRKS